MSLSKSETATEITYTGVGALDGVTVIVKKDDDHLDVRHCVPAAKANQTWQDVRDRLDAT